MKLRNRIACVCAVSLPLTIAGCGGGEDPAAGGGGGGAFVLAVAADPQNLDPHGALSALRGTLQTTRLLYDPLVNLANDGRALPGIAESWQVTGSEVVFRLRKVTCADGAPLTASTVAANVDYVTDADNASPMRGIGVPADVEATADDAKGTVTLSSESTPAPFLLNQLSLLGIVCPSGLKNRESLTRGSAGTGPYTVTTAVTGSEYRLARRAGYAWGPPGDPAGTPPASIVIKVIDNETTAANLLVSKQINAAAVRGSEQRRLRAARLTARTFREPIGQLWFSQRDGHLTADEKVRSALIQAADLAEVGKVATQGAGVPSRGLMKDPLVCGGVTPASAIVKSDRTAAEATLTGAGWKRSGKGWAKGGEPLAIKFLYPTSLGPSVSSAIELLTTKWKDFGVAVTVKAASDAEFGKILLTTGDWDVEWGVTSPKVPTQLLPFVSGPQPPKGRNFAGIDNDNYRELTTADASAGPDCAKWNAAEMSLFGSTSIVPLDDIEVPVFTNNAAFELGGIGGQILPTTLRVR